MTVGCGEETDDDDEDIETTTGELKGITINCPTEVTADWIQAANGRKNVIRAQTRAVIWRDQPSPNLVCRFDNRLPPPIIQQVVSFKPGSVDSVCGAKATISGQATTSGGVPPFGGFVFKSKRIQAASAYDSNSGICILSLPAAPSGISIKMSKGCNSVSDTGYVCPQDAYIVDTAIY
jgi:hypothetical protein